MSTNHTIIPASTVSAMLPLGVSDHLESEESSLPASGEAEKNLLRHTPVARQSPPLPRSRDAGFGGHMRGQQQCTQGGE